MMDFVIPACAPKPLTPTSQHPGSMVGTTAPTELPIGLSSSSLLETTSWSTAALVSQTEQCCVLPTQSKATEDFGPVSTLQSKSLPVKGSTSADWAAKLAQFPQLPEETITKARGSLLREDFPLEERGRQSNSLPVSPTRGPWQSTMLRQPTPSTERIVP